MKSLKILALLLALIMAFSAFAGCAAKEPASGEISSREEAEEEQTRETEPEVMEEETPEEEPVPEETEAPAKEEPAAEEAAVSLGRKEGGIYTNSYAGFGCELDENWAFYTAEELQEIPENVQELLSDTELGESMDQYPQIMDMSAENANDLTVMNVLYTKLSMDERLTAMSVTERELLESTLGQQDAMKEAYAASGLEFIGMEIVPITFLGESHYGLKTHTSIEGIDYYVLQYQNYKLGTYGVTLTVGSYFEDKTTQLLDLFFAVD